MKKLFAVIVYCLLFTVCCFSQTWQWAQRGGGTDYDNGVSIAVDKAGNCYITGTYSSSPAIFGTYTLPLNAFSDIFLAKYDSNGNILWVKHAGGLTTVPYTGNGGTSISVDSLGNCYVTGSFVNKGIFDSDSVTSNGGNDIFIAKYNSSGNIIWVKNAGGSGYDYGQGISINKNNEVFVTGNFNGTASFGSYTVTASANGDDFIAKYDDSGNCLWVRQSNGGASVNAITSDGIGNCYITGGLVQNATVTFGIFSLSDGGNGTMFIVKYDSSGNCIWAKSASGTGGVSVSIDAINNIYVTGDFQGTVVIGTYTLTSSGSYDIFVAKYDNNGNCIWAKEGGGTASDASYSITTTPSGTSYIIGNCYSAFNFGNCSLPGTDMFIIKVDSSGSCLGITGADALPVSGTYAIGIDTSGNLYITGSFQNTATFGSTTLTSAGQNDVFVAKLNGLTSIQENNNKSSNFIIYPNPSRSSYTMEVTNDFLNSQMFIYNSLGSLIFQSKITQEHTEINIPSLPQGVYEVKLVKPNGSSAQRSIVQQ